MNNSSENKQSSDATSRSKKPEKIINSRWLTYIFLVALLMYVILCMYVLVFAGSLFVEAVVKGWYKASTSEYNAHSFMLGFEYGFACLCGVIGGLVVLSKKLKRSLKYKYYIRVLLFVPSVIWSTFLVIGNFRWGFQYWTQLLFLGPIMFLCIFVTFCVVKMVNIPYFAPDSSNSQETNDPKYI
ncbi:MAG TPA: hypothetical protein ENH82_08790 [bacterium]|nr:hypothetical protein [bacterium]